MSKDYKDAPNPLIGAFAKACDNNQADAFVNKFVSYNSGATAIGVKINPTPTTKDHTASQELQQLGNLKAAQLAIAKLVAKDPFTAKWVSDSSASPAVKADSLKDLSDHIAADAKNLAKITQQPNILKYATTLTANTVTDAVKAATVMLTKATRSGLTADDFAPAKYLPANIAEEFTTKAQTGTSDVTSKIPNLNKFYKNIGTAASDTTHTLYCDATSKTLKAPTVAGTTAAAIAGAAMNEITTFLPDGEVAGKPCITVTPADVVTAFNNLANNPSAKIADTSTLADAKTAVGTALYTTDATKLKLTDLQDLTKVDATTQSYFSALACLDGDATCKDKNAVTGDDLVKVINKAINGKLSDDYTNLNGAAIQNDGLATTLTTPVLKYVVKTLQQSTFLATDGKSYDLNENNLLKSTDATQNTKLSALTDAYCPTGDNKCVANLDKYIKEVVWAKAIVGDKLTANDKCAATTMQTDKGAACVGKLKVSTTLQIDTLQADELDAYAKCVAGSTDDDLKCDA